MIKLEYELTRDEYLAFNTATLKRVEKRKGGHKGIVLSAVVTGIFIVLLFNIELLGIHVDWFSVSSGALVTLVVLVISATYVTRRMQLRTLPMEGGYMLGPRTLTISEHEIVETGINHTGTVTMAGVIECVENKDFFLLYFDSMFGAIIPKRAFDSESQMDELRQLLKK